MGVPEAGRQYLSGAHSAPVGAYERHIRIPEASAVVDVISSVRRVRGPGSQFGFHKRVRSIRPLPGGVY